MDLVIELLKTDLLELRNHLEFTEKIKIEILSSSDNFKYSRSSIKRKFDYNSVIISLYGLIENYIEKYCYEYIENIEKIITDYNFLETKFRYNHFNLSIELIKKIIENRHSKFSNISKEIVLNNLNYCITNGKNFKLNKEAFTLTTGNLKHSKICETIGYLNIKLDQKLKHFSEFKSNTENIFNPIDDLVQRRNEIAHGNIQDILDSTSVFPLIDFVSNYLFSIGRVLKEELDQISNLNKKTYQSVFINDIKVISEKILGIQNGKKYNLNKGDEVLIEKSDKNIISCVIVDIKSFDNNDITIKLSSKIKDSYSFYKVN